MAIEAGELTKSHPEKKTVDHFKRFRETPIGGLLSVPLGVLNPTTIDHFQTSHTSGPLDVYLLRHSQTGEVKMWIADGNTRYHKQNRDAKYEATSKGGDYDPGIVETTVRKIIPAPENDARVMFRMEGWELAD